MSKTYTALKAACEDVGISLPEACRRANVDASVVRRWKYQEPKTLRILAAVNEVIDARKRSDRP